MFPSLSSLFGSSNSTDQSLKKGQINVKNMSITEESVWTMEQLTNFLEVKAPSRHLELTPIHLKTDLDIINITSQIWVSGAPWQRRTETQIYRNNFDGLYTFIKKKKYRIFNISNIVYPEEFNVVHKEFHYVLTDVFQLIRAIAGWTHLHKSHIAIIHCSNGIKHTSILTSALLRYLDIFQSTLESFDYFVLRRSPFDQEWITCKHIRYIHYLNDIFNFNGQVPNPNILILRKIIMNGVPEYQSLPCQPLVEVYQSNKEIYADNQDIFVDEFNIVVNFSKDVLLDQDIVIKFSHLQDKNIPINLVKFSFNTGFTSAGLVRLLPKDLEFPKHKNCIFHPDFSIDVVFMETNHHKKLNYTHYLDKLLHKELYHLSLLIPVELDLDKCHILQEQSFNKLSYELALKLAKNDLHLATEYLITSFKDLNEKLKSELKVAGQKQFLQKQVKSKLQRMSGYTQFIQAEDGLVDLHETPHVSDSESIEQVDQVEHIKEEIEEIPTVTVDPVVHHPTEVGVIKQRKQRNTPNPTPKATPQASPIKESFSQSSGPPAPPPPPPVAFIPQALVPLPPGVPPPPPPPGFGGPAIVDNKPRLRNKIQFEQPKVNNRNSIWGLQDIDNSIELDINKFEDLFCVTPNDTKIKPVEIKKPENSIISLLDMRKSNNIAIGLSKYKQFTFDELRVKLATFQMTNTDDLVQLASLLPNEEDCKLIRLGSKDKSKQYGTAEQFMMKMMEDPNIERFSEIQIYRLTFDEEIKRINHILTEFTLTCKLLISNNELKILLKTVLNLGNLATYEYGTYNKQKIKGFKINNLLKLNTIKSSDKKTNLLNYLCLMTSEGCPDVLLLPDTFKCLQELKDLSTKEATDKLKIMDQELMRIEKFTPLPIPLQVKASYGDFNYDAFMTDFINKAIDAMDNCLDVQDAFQQSWEQCAEYFGEDLEGDIQAPEDLFKVLYQFFEMLKNANNENERIKENQKRKMQQLKEKRQRQIDDISSVLQRSASTHKGTIDTKFINLRKAVDGDDSEEEWE